MAKSTNSSTASLEPTREGGCILTGQGVTIYPMDARPEEVTLEDIAGSLSKLCRYTGHVRKFYSVAEHSVRVADLIADAYTDERAYSGLMHDASEAYLGDVARPIKKAGNIGELYEAAEEKLMHIIAVKFNFEWPMPEYVRWADNVLLHTEQRDLMPYPNDLYTLDGYEMIVKPIEPWSPAKAERKFLERYAELCPSA